MHDSPAYTPKEPADRRRGGLQHVGAVWQRIENATIATLMAVLFLLIAYQVLARHLVTNPPVWTEEVARYGMVWLTFLAGVVASRRGTHTAVSTITEMFSPPIRRKVHLLADLVVATTILLLIPGALASMEVGWSLAGSASGISRGWLFFGAFAGLVGMLCYTLLGLIRPARKENRLERLAPGMAE